MIKQYRYSNFLDGKIISESDWLLQASNSQGQIYDNLRKKFIEPHPYPFLIEDAFEILKEGKRLSEILVRDETLVPAEVLFENQSEFNILYSLCINPEVKVMFKKKTVDRETGEVEETDYQDEIEKAIHLHTQYLKEVAYLMSKPRAVAECDSADELGVLEESLQEAKSRLLGHEPNKRNWRDFLSK